jgi:GNAT superfamily N-acetyltransferase
MAIEIRRAVPTDAPALTRVAHAAKRHWRYPEEWILQWKAALTVDESYVAARPVYCAVEDAECVGFYALIGEGATWELDHMWVAPSRIGAGVGTRLFEHALLTLRKAGGRTLKIVSDPNAEGFYRKMGAVRVGEEPSTPEGRKLPVLEFSL